MNITDFLGKRILAKVGHGIYSTSDVMEYKVIEISPSGNWAKLMNTHGNKFWKAVADISFVEELKDIKADKPGE